MSRYGASRRSARTQPNRWWQPAQARWPSAAREAVGREIRRSLSQVPLPERDIGTLALDAPPVPLWKDRTELCDPAAANDHAIRRMLRRITQWHPFYETDAFLAVPERVVMWLFVDADGTVARVNVLVAARRRGRGKRTSLAATSSLKL